VAAPGGPVAPSITVQPADQSIKAGQTATYSVTATGPVMTPVLGGTATCPSESTTVFPPGSGKDPCKNQAGAPPSEGPRVAG
jgi:hypothetical protein